MSTTDELRIELAFSREVSELPDFPRLATRAFQRELAKHADVFADADALEEEKIRSACFRQRLAERDAEVVDLQAQVNDLLREVAGIE